MEREPIVEPFDVEQRREQRGTSPSARIIRGFSRIGIGLAIISAITGVAVTGGIVVGNYNRANDEFDKYACLLRWNANAAVSGARYKALTESAANCGYFPSYGAYNSLSWIRINDAIEQNGFIVERVTDFERLRAEANTTIAGLGITGATSLVIFGFFRGLGWIIAGFARD
jgi:hypothetical protein